MSESASRDRQGEVADAVRSGTYAVDALLVADSILTRWSGRALSDEWTAKQTYAADDLDSSEASSC